MSFVIITVFVTKIPFLLVILFGSSVTLSVMDLSGVRIITEPGALSPSLGALLETYGLPS